MSQEQQNGIVKVAILTPYLSDDLAKRADADYVRLHTEKFGYDPNNFHNVRALESPLGRNVFIIHRDDLSFKEAVFGPVGSDFCIAGNTSQGEKEIEMLKGSGLIIGRYSTFYGRCSGYTGNAPEDAGYALDIPKHVEVVRNLLTHDGFLEAVVAREESSIRAALDALNAQLEQPVLITPFLVEALGVRR